MKKPDISSPKIDKRLTKAYDPRSEKRTKYHNIAVRPEVFETIREQAHRLRVPLGGALAAMMMRTFRREIDARIERAENDAAK